MAIGSNKLEDLLKLVIANNATLLISKERATIESPNTKVKYSLCAPPTVDSICKMVERVLCE